MNVLLVTNESDALVEGSPAQLALIEKAKAADRLMVVVMNSFWHRQQPRKVGESLWIFPTNALIRPLQLLFVMRVVRREIFFRNHLQADIISGSDPFFCGIAANILAVRYRKPLHLAVVGNPLSSLATRSISRLIKYIFARIVIPYGDALTIDDEGTYAILQKIDASYKERATLIPRFYDVDAAQKDDGEDLHVKYTQFRAVFLVVGPLVRQYNIHVAVQAIAESSKYYQNIGLVIVGSGPRKAMLERYARSLGIGERVKFEQPRADLTSYYKTCYALIMPAFTESFGTTLEEAAAAGTAIISSPVGIAPRIIESGTSGFLCDPKDPKEFFKAVDALVYSPAMRTQMKTGIVEKMRAYMNSIKVDQVQLYRQSFKKTLKASKEASMQ